MMPQTPPPLYRPPAQQPANPYPNVDQSVQQQIMASQRLSPQQKQQMLQNLNSNTAAPFNPFTATVQSLGQGAKQVGQGIANMTGVPSAIDATRLGVADLTGNQNAANAATSRLANNLPQFLPVALGEGAKPFLQDVATAAVSPYANYKANQAEAYAQKELGDDTSDPAYNASVDAYAANQKQQLLEGLLNGSGFTSQTPTSTLVRKEAGRAGQAAASVAMAGSLDGVASGASKEGQLLLNMLNFGAQNAASNVSQVAQTDKPTLGDYVGAAATGFTQGAAMSAIFHGASPAAETAADTARTGLEAASRGVGDVANAINDRLAINPDEAERGSVELPGKKPLPNPDDTPQLSPHDQQQLNRALNGEKVGYNGDYIENPRQFEETLAQAQKSTNPATPPINRTQLTGSMLDMPNRELQPAMDSEAFAKTFGISHAEARAAMERLRQQNEEAKNRRLPPQKRQVPQRAPEENTALNPIKKNFGDVQPGDYQKARVAAQEAESGINLRARQAYNAIPKDMTTSKLARLVQGIDLPSTNAERTAIQRYRDLTNEVHATNQASGGNTNFRQNYFRGEWDLSNPADQAKFDQLVAQKYGKNYDPSKFAGLDRQPKVFDTIAEGEAAGFHLAHPLARDEIADYATGSSLALKNQVLAKAMEKADINETEKPVTVDMGNGKYLKVSAKAAAQMLPYERLKQLGWLGKSYDAINKTAKGTLLSISEFHPINIGVMKAGPGLVFAGHPINAAKGVGSMFVGQIGRKFADAGIQDALTDHLPVITDGGNTTLSTAEAGAKIGMPLLQHTDFNATGKLQLGKSGVGERTIFEKSIPLLQKQVIRSIVSDLTDKGVSLDSVEARKAGDVGSKMMGAMNGELKNLDPNNARRWGRILLANQFTRAKWSLMKDALTQAPGSVAGTYARSTIIGNYAMHLALIAGIGYLAHQQSDNIRDMLIRALIDPSVPTPWQDSKGNTMDLRLPASYNSEFLGLFFNINRGADGHLQIQFQPGSLKQNLTNYGLYRLAELPSDALKIWQNQNFANKPLYDPNAPLGTQVAQGATTLATNTLPIGLQGLTETNAVKSHLPGPIQQVLNAETPGSNPVVKSALSSFGFTPRTDSTVGQGQQTAQYFNALDQAKQGLNQHEQDILDAITGSKKNPVTGQYDVMPLPDDSRTKAADITDNPNVLDHLMQMNQTLAAQGQNVDPLWLQSKDHIIAYYNYQQMPPGGTDRTNWMNQNQSWYTPLANARTAYFNTLPSGDPNKPQSPIQYPTASLAVQQLQDQFFNSTPQQQHQMLLDHPELLQQFQAEHDYTNQMRQAEGYTPLNGSPTPSSRVQSLLNQASASGSKSVAAQIYSDPEVSAYLQASSVYELSKNAGLAQLQGNQLDQQALKAAYEIGNYDLAKNPNGQYALANPILLPTGGYMPSGMMAGATPIGSSAKYGSSGSGNKYYQNAGIPGMKHRLVPYPKRTFSTTLTTAKKGAKLFGSVASERAAGVHAKPSHARGTVPAKKPLPNRVSAGSSGLQLTKRKVLKV